jgi:hypothetical protein
MQNRNNRPRTSPASISSMGESISEVLTELKNCVSKLTTISHDISENGLEYSFGHYVANELLRTPEPRRSEIRRTILTLLTNESKFRLTSGD